MAILNQANKNKKKIGIVRQFFMPTEELIEYNRETRAADFEDGKPLNGINLRKRFYFIVKGIVKADRILSKEKIKIINDQHIKTNRPHIYVCNHIGGNEIQRIIEIINDPAYLMLGDPGPLYKSLIYIVGLKTLLGVLPLETRDKNDRKIAYKRSLELLKKGGSLLIFAEGAWNISPNVIVNKTFPGTTRMATDTGVVTEADIVPLAVEQYGDTFYFNIGRNYIINSEGEKLFCDSNGNYTISGDDKSFDAFGLKLYEKPSTIVKNGDKGKIERLLNEDLRDTLATLKYGILEYYSKLARDGAVVSPDYDKSKDAFKRSEIPEGYLKDFQQEIVNKCNYTGESKAGDTGSFTIAEAEMERFHSKDEEKEKEVLETMGRLQKSFIEEMKAAPKNNNGKPVFISFNPTEQMTEERKKMLENLMNEKEASRALVRIRVPKEIKRKR